MSGCNLTRGCAEDDCGMFRITRVYWIDAGRPTLQLDNPDTDGGKIRFFSEYPKPPIPISLACMKPFLKVLHFYEFFSLITPKLRIESMQGKGKVCLV